MATTQDIWDHHVQGFVARDVSMVLEDFTDDSLVKRTARCSKAERRLVLPEHEDQLAAG